MTINTNILNELKITGSIIFNNHIYYKENINERIDKMYSCIASQLKSVQDTVIAIAMNRGLDYVIANLMSLKYGITFLNIDLTWPAERIQYIWDNSKVSAIVCNKQSKIQLEDSRIVYVDDYINCECIEAVNQENDVAYILYTSGTTGKPKGVEVTRDGLYWFIKDVVNRIDFSDSETIACFTNQTFDIYFLELFLSLLNGFDIVLGDDDDIINPRRMISLIKKHNVDTLQMTPSKLRMLQAIDNEYSFLESVKILMIGGEQFPKTLLWELNKHSNIKIYNMYGPTETTIWSSIAELTGMSEVNIGTPLNHTFIYLLDENHNPVKDGKEGEIAIGGKGLAKGYKNNQELTNQKFICMEDGQRVYLTGDIGRYAEGNLLCLGRVDNQVKINGHRIELEEIDSLLDNFKKIENSITCFDEKKNKIITFFTAQTEVLDADLVKYLSEYIPKYMIPTCFVHTDKLMFTSSGKSDRKAMLEFDSQDEEKALQKDDSKHLQLFDEVVTIIHEVSESNQPINPDMTFNEIGMDSIQFISIIVEIEDKYNIFFDDENMLLDKYSSFKDFVDYIDNKIKES